MEDKFKMTREQNIFLAKRNVVDYIYKSARLEGINITFPETQAIFDGMGVEGVKVDNKWLLVITDSSSKVVVSEEEIGVK